MKNKFLNNIIFKWFQYNLHLSLFIIEEGKVQNSFDR